MSQKVYNNSIEVRPHDIRENHDQISNYVLFYLKLQAALGGGGQIRLQQWL